MQLNKKQILAALLAAFLLFAPIGAITPVEAAQTPTWSTIQEYVGATQTTYVAPADGWYLIHAIGQGGAGATRTGDTAYTYLPSGGGGAGGHAEHMVYLRAGQSVLVDITRDSSDVTIAGHTVTANGGADATTAEGGTGGTASGGNVGNYTGGDGDSAGSTSSGNGGTVPNGVTYTLPGAPGTASDTPQDANFTYTGDWDWYDAGETIIRLKTSGDIQFNADASLQVFLVGGGGGGAGQYVTSWGGACGGGGGGGYTTTEQYNALADTVYPAAIGEGGIAGNTYVQSEQRFNGGQGGETSLFGISALGGDGGHCLGPTANIWSGAQLGGNGGSGGGGCGANGADAGSDGGNGGNGIAGNGVSGYNRGGSGQGTTTRAFGESSGVLFAGGGGGACTSSGAGGSGGDGGGGTGGGSPNYNATAGAANTGGGGGGGNAVTGSPRYFPANGGSGVILIRMPFYFGADGQDSANATGYGHGGGGGGAAYIGGSGEAKSTGTGGAGGAGAVVIQQLSSTIETPFLAATQPTTSTVKVYSAQSKNLMTHIMEQNTTVATDPTLLPSWGIEQFIFKAPSSALLAEYSGTVPDSRGCAWTMTINGQANISAELTLPYDKTAIQLDVGDYIVGGIWYKVNDPECGLAMLPSISGATLSLIDGGEVATGDTDWHYAYWIYEATTAGTDIKLEACPLITTRTAATVTINAPQWRIVKGGEASTGMRDHVLTKWAYGEHDAAYFADNGTAFSATTLTGITEGGPLSVYSKDTSTGAEAVRTITLTQAITAPSELETADDPGTTYQPGSMITLRWSRVPGATGYTVTRTLADGTITPVYTGTDTSCTDTLPTGIASQNVVYSVTATNGEETTSARTLSLRLSQPSGGGSSGGSSNIVTIAPSQSTAEQLAAAKEQAAKVQAQNAAIISGLERDVESLQEQLKEMLLDYIEAQKRSEEQYDAIAEQLAVITEQLTAMQEQQRQEASIFGIYLPPWSRILIQALPMPMLLALLGYQGTIARRVKHGITFHFPENRSTLEE